MQKHDQLEWIDLVEQFDYPTPFKLTKLSRLHENVSLLKEALPRVDIFYAMKSASDPEAIASLDPVVYGYDIASLGEFEKLRELGVSSDRMLYSNPVKIPGHIQKTYDEGVRYYAFDSLSEIKKLAEFAPESSVYLRVKVSDYGSRFPLSKKFGVDPIHAVPYMDMAREMGLNACGLSFHVGSQSENPHTWDVAFETCGKIIKKLKVVGIDVKFLNMGGGLPSTYVERIPSITQIAKVINHSIKTHIPEDVHIVAEPGRFISADASVIVTSVIGREHRGNEEWLFLDMGVFQGLMECLEMPDWRYPMFTKRGDGTLPYANSYTLTGPSCDAYDTIGFDYLLPPDMDVGDRIFIGSAGAYTSVYESNFNGFEPPKKYYIK